MAGHQDRSSPQAADPVPTRIGRLTLIVAVVVVAAVSIGSFLRAEPTDESPSVTPDAEIGAKLEQRTLAGSPAPDFEVPLFDGSEFSLSAHLGDDGRPVVLNLWASWCVPCRREMPALDDFAAEHPEVLMLGVAVEDTRANAEAFAEEVNVSYPLGIDEEAALAGRYPYFGLPVTWVIDSDGMVVRQLIGEVNIDLLDRIVTQDLGLG